MLPAIIRIDNIVKKYGPLTVLDGLSMNVMPGEKLALIGPSGSGKTTILRILMTLETISGGHIEVDGEQLYTCRTVVGCCRPTNGICIGCAKRSAWSFSISICSRINACSTT